MAKRKDSMNKHLYLCVWAYVSLALVKRLSEDPWYTYAGRGEDSAAEYKVLLVVEEAAGKWEEKIAKEQTPK